LLLNAVLRRLCRWAPAPPLSIDISCSHGAQQQTRRTPLLLSIDGTDRRTDEPFHRPCFAYYAVSVSTNCRLSRTDPRDALPRTLEPGGANFAKTDYVRYQRRMRGKLPSPQERMFGVKRPISILRKKVTYLGNKNRPAIARPTMN